MKGTHATAFILVIIGGLNWGLVGLGEWFGHNWNLINIILGSWPVVEGLVYVLVGISAIILICTHRKNCKMCDKPASSAPTM